MERIRLQLLGITYNQIESGVYAVILREVDGNRRIPIIIGYPEAQAIECKLQEVVTPRPLTHDMMMNFMTEFGISLKEIEIRRLPSGVFAADIIFSDGTNTHTIDSRSSDAIALAIRAGAPIYTSEAVMDEAGIIPEEKEKENRKPFGETSRSPKASIESNESSDPDADAQVPSDSNDPSLSSFEKRYLSRGVEEMKKAMQRAAENEDYEEAARIKAILDKLNSKP